MKQDLIKSVSKLFNELEKNRKKGLVVALCISIGVGVVEMLSVGAILPYLKMLTSPKGFEFGDTYGDFVNRLMLDNSNPIFLVTFGLVLLISLSGIMRLYNTFFITRLSFEIGADLSNKIYKNALNQPYEVHINRSSSEVIAAITTNVDKIIHHVVLPTLTMISALIMCCLLIGFLVWLNPFVAIVCGGTISLVYALLSYTTKNRLNENSKISARETQNIIKNLQEGLGAIRDTLLDGTQHIYEKIYYKADYELRKSQADNHFIAQSPRYIVESLGMLVIVGTAYYLSCKSSADEFVPVLGVFALAAQRLIPLAHSAYASFSFISGSSESIHIATKFLNQQTTACFDNYSSLPFENSIRLEDVSFSYSRSKFILKDINLEVRKGSVVGIIGATGSGKSTLVDLMMGLISPTSGKMWIDTVEINNVNVRSWQRKIAHVPQNIFISDATIRENIAFGIISENIDMGRVRDSARKAQLDFFIENLQYGYETLAGEMGFRFSGGQRQRLGIARAFYKNSSLLILDEATSALDKNTEEEVMQAVYNKHSSLTVIIIAHRESTLSMCDKIYRIENGSVSLVKI